ncbi:MAG: ribose 5-phosphate isomerase B [Pseudomonadota bacterium]
MKLIIGSDHAGFLLKEAVKQFLTGCDVEVTDIGTKSESSVDYTDFGIKVAQAVAEARFQKGILICGTGMGMSMTANRFRGVRAALANDLFSAIMSRRHNDSNVLALGGRVLGEGLAFEIVKAWLATPFEGGRHHRRIEKMDNPLL